MNCFLFHLKRKNTMELSFSYYYWIAMLKNQPYILPFAIGFGMLFIIPLITSIFGPLVPTRFKKVSTVLGILPLLITWPIGFMVSIPMMLSDINVIHILLSIVVIYSSALMFCIINLNILVIFLENFKDTSFLSKKITCVNEKSQTKMQNTTSSKSRLKNKSH